MQIYHTGFAENRTWLALLGITRYACLLKLFFECNKGKITQQFQITQTVALNHLNLSTNLNLTIAY